MQVSTLPCGMVYLGMEFDAFYNYTYDILTAMGGDYHHQWEDIIIHMPIITRQSSKEVEITVSHRNKLNLAETIFLWSQFQLDFCRNRYLRYPDSPNTVEWKTYRSQCRRFSRMGSGEGLFRSEEEMIIPHGKEPVILMQVTSNKDLNGDGKIDEDDRTRVGRGNRPELTYGLNLNCAWNGFDLSTIYRAHCSMYH